MVIDRSDYGPFQRRKVPYLFFSTGENPCYHTPQDVAETIDWAKLTSISGLICHVAVEASNTSTTPVWNDSPKYDDDEPIVIRDILTLMLEHREELKIGFAKVAFMRRVLKVLDEVKARGSITSDELRIDVKGGSILDVHSALIMVLRSFAARVHRRGRS